MASNITWARNLNKNQLGGVIFGCTKSTIKECLANQLFGLPSQHFLYVKNIEPGLPLFLFNYSERKLHGIFEAASSGKMSIDSYAWTANGSERTKYPAQVQILLRLHCQPLAEHQFKPIIADNYYSQSHFWFELDHAQVSKLISKFSPLAVALRPFIPPNPRKWTAVKEWVPSNKEKEEAGAPQRAPLRDDFDNFRDSIGTLTSLEDSPCWDGNDQFLDKSLSNQKPESCEKDLIYMKLKELALSSEFPGAHLRHAIGAESKSDKDLEHETRVDDQVPLGKRNSGSSFDSLDDPVIIAQLLREIDELKTFKQEQTQKTNSLEKKLAEAEQEICRLENRCMILESSSNTSMRLSGNEKMLDSHDELYFNLNGSILIVGGYDGESWSSSLGSFLPSYDVLRSLKPMSSDRSYASVARFNGELYVFGGGTGSMWYDTVESYNAVQNEWTLRPSLNKEKGSLGGAALNGKIFAVGGGNGVECFSDVEMFDPYVGRWICARSMLQKRFAVAAVELGGAVYAVGGYDGNDYVKYAIGGYDGTMMVASMEIYDPRVGTWITGEPMNEGRGYLAAAVLEECIYVIGGVRSDEGIVDKIECYKEGQGWETTNLRAVGKRCFASAIVLLAEED